jgi:hypothetical protein
VAAGFQRLRQTMLPDRYALTVCVTECAPEVGGPEVPADTTDFFSWRHFLEPADYPRFARYLVETRETQAVVILGSRAAYRLLPYLQARFPELPCWEFQFDPAREVALQEAACLELRLLNISAEPGEPDFAQPGAASRQPGLFRRLFTPQAAGDVALRLADYHRLSASLQTAAAWWQIDTPWLERRRTRLYRLKRRWVWPAQNAVDRWLRRVSPRRSAARPAARGPA